MSRKEIVLWAVGVAVGLAAVVALCVFMGRADDRADARERLGIKLAADACLPHHPVDVDREGAGWSGTSHWRVRCPDGELRIIPAYPELP